MGVKESFLSSIGGLVGGNARADISRAALHSLFPNDFEYYLIALEIIDSDGNSDGYIVFPVMPSSLSETFAPLSSVENTMTGVSLMHNEKFAPIKIQMEGTFGVNLRILVTKSHKVTDADAYSAQKSPVSNLNGLSAFDGGDGNLEIVKTPYKENSSEMSPHVKTGWGTLRVLEAIVKRAGTKDKHGLPKILCLYNSATGNNYVVKVDDFVKSIQEANHVMWRYSLSLTAVAPLEWYLKKTARNDSPSKDALSVDGIQKAVGATTKFLGKLI